MQVTAEYLLSWAFGRRVEHDGHENLTQAAQRVLKDPSAGGWRAHTARTFLDNGNTYPTRLRRAECGKRYADGVERLRRHDEETKAALKALKVERAAERDKIAEPNDELGAMVRSGTEIRDVPVTFLRSFAQNRKWVVRNDTGEELKDDGYAAEPLTAKDRQQMLLSEDDMGVSADDDGAEITDPAALLDDANDDGEA
jgi:hypothetical protein